MTRAQHIAIFRHGSSGAQRAADVLLLPEWRDEEWGKLFACTRPYPCRESEVIIKGGDSDRGLFFVANGLFEVGITQVDGVSISPLARIGPGSVIGEQSFFDGLARSANVWAVTAGELLRLDFDDFGRFGRDEPALARDLLFALGRVLSVRLRNTTFRVRR